MKHKKDKKEKEREEGYIEEEEESFSWFIGPARDSLWICYAHQFVNFILLRKTDTWMNSMVFSLIIDVGHRYGKCSIRCKICYFGRM
jgi:hypothetical protein